MKPLHISCARRYHSLPIKKGATARFLCVKVTLPAHNTLPVCVCACRYPSLPITELTRHHAPVNGVAWAPHSSAHVCTAGDDSQVRARMCLLHVCTALHPCICTACMPCCVCALLCACFSRRWLAGECAHAPAVLTYASLAMRAC
eukprot:1146656-Pelagomonas_calceolata.AAC.1